MHTKPLSITVALSLLLSLVPTPAFAGGRLTVQDSIAGLELQAELTGFAGNASVVVAVQTPSEDVSLPARTNADGDAIVTIPATLTEMAGDYTAFIKQNGNRVTPDVPFIVLPGRVSAADSFLDTDKTTLRADGKDSATVTVTITDQYGNPLTGRPVELISNRAGDRITALDDETDDTGAQRFTVTTTKAGNFDLSATDILSDQTLSQVLSLTAGSSLGTGGPIQRSVLTAQASGSDNTDTGDDDGAVSFEITLTPDTAMVGQELDLRVTALREDGSKAQGYTRQPSIWAPEDPDAIVPGFGTLIFRKAENGDKKCLQCVTFTVPGPQTLVVEDTLADGTVIRGEVQIDIDMSPDYEATHKIQILSHRDGGKIASNNIVLEGIGPALANLLITGGEDDVQTETDDKGMFSVALTLDPDSSEYTIRVRAIDQNNTSHAGPSEYDSGNLHLMRDNSGPDLSYQFDPSEPSESQDVQLTVQSEPNLKSVTLKIGDETKTLSENADQKGTYSVFFEAPAAGDHQLPIIALDEAGNTTEVRASVHINPRKLPKVQNVHAEPGPTGMRLSWDPLTDTGVESYMVFVGTDDSVSQTTLETTGAVTDANVMGLDAGTEYFFAVAGMLSGTEGERSDVISAHFGPQVEMTPGVGTITLTIEDRGTTPLVSYLLEFSADDGVYTNQVEFKATEPGTDGVRRVQYVLHDLLDATTYSIRLTPRATTTELLAAQSITRSVKTLNANGFVASDDTGPSPFDGAPSDDLHSGAPNVPGSGVPMIAIALLALISGAIFFLRRRNNQKATQAFLQQMQSRYNR